MILPSKLKKGDQVLIIAPARKVDISSLEAAEKLLLDWGLIPIRAKNLLSENGIFSGTDHERKQDLQWALDHQEAKAIWCYRGGYGSIQLVEELNPSNFLMYPKWIIGFSDITVLHCFSNIILNSCSIHATMPINVKENSEETLLSLKKILFKYSMDYQWAFSNENIIGKCEGEIIGGNLAVLCSTLGTSYQPDFEGKILFIEDIDEYLYRIDRMLWQLKFAGVFHHINGIIIGHFSNIKDNKIPFGKSLKQIILEKTKEFNFPIAFDFPSGHENDNWSLLFGKRVKFQVEKNYNRLISI